MTLFVLLATTHILHADYSAQASEFQSANHSMNQGEIFTPNLAIKDFRGKFTYPMGKAKLEDAQIKRAITEQRSINNYLARVKFEMINGNLDKAKVLLLDEQFDQNFSMPIQYRYLAIINFIEGNYQRSLELLQKKEMYQEGNNQHVCLLRNLNYLILNRHFEAINDWSFCQGITRSSSQHLWMDTLVKLKTSKSNESFKKVLANINIENERDDFLRIYLKLALYLNQPDKIFARIPYLGESIYEVDSTRELLGLLFYRKGDLKTAYQFIEDLETPNSENIKGNLYLAQKKYELAYAQFKLALKRKKSSQNSLERIIPVAWMLRQWKDGLDFTQALEVNSKDQLKKLLILAAFEIQLEKFADARAKLEKIVISSKSTQSKETNQLLSYVTLMQKDLNSTRSYNLKSCKDFYGLNCWLQYHLSTWDDFSLTIKRDENIHTDIKTKTQTEKSLLDEYRSNFKPSPLAEDIYIGQPDIEELDNVIMQKYQ